jgi:hypothetical protein
MKALEVLLIPLRYILYLAQSLALSPLLRDPVERYYIQSFKTVIGSSLYSS